MERLDILDAKGRVVGWRIAVGRQTRDVPVPWEDDASDAEAAARLRRTLETPSLFGPMMLRGEWSAEWMRRVGPLTVAELVLYPGVPYSRMTKEQRLVCETFAQSWSMELTPSVWIDQRRDREDAAPGYSVGAMMWREAA